MDIISSKRVFFFQNFDFPVTRTSEYELRRRLPVATIHVHVPLSASWPWPRISSYTRARIYARVYLRVLHAPHFVLFVTRVGPTKMSGGIVWGKEKHVFQNGKAFSIFDLPCARVYTHAHVHTRARDHHTRQKIWHFVFKMTKFLRRRYAFYKQETLVLLVQTRTFEFELHRCSSLF